MVSVLGANNGKSHNPWKKKEENKIAHSWFGLRLYLRREQLPVIHAISCETRAALMTPEVIRKAEQCDPIIR
jgi:hypothetical protein